MGMRPTRRRTKLTAVAALASAASLARCPTQSLAFSPIKSRASPTSLGEERCCDLKFFSPSQLQKGIHDRPSSPSSSQLNAFWSRGIDTGTPDETKRNRNTFLRRILPRGSNEQQDRSEGSQAGAAVSKRKRTTGRPSSSTSGGSGSNRTRTRSSTSARYYYSAATLNEQCPSWVPGASEDECPIDDSVWGSYDDVAAAALSAELDSSGDGGSAEQQKRASRLVEDALDGFIHRHALHTMNLKITSDATSRSAVLLRGYVGSVHASFDRLSFPALKLSGGGKISAIGLSLNTASFVPALGRFVRRWRNPFQFHAKDCVLTDEDLRTSRCIRTGLANVGTRILRRVVASDSSLDVVRIDRGARLSVSSVEILENSMLSARGIITTIVGTSIPFVVRTGLKVSNGGHVLHFPGLEVILNPGSPLQVTMPLHLVHQVDLDLGDNACIDSVEIDGRRKQIRLSATATVTPRAAIASAAAASGAAIVAKRAKYAVDVGSWLTNLGRFTT